MTDEILALDLDWDLLNHLALPNSVFEFQGESLAPELIEDDQVRLVYEWTMHHLQEHGQPASASVIEDEFDFVAFEPPLSAVRDLIRRIRQRYLRNQGRQEITHVAEVYKEDPLLVPHALQVAHRNLAKLTTAAGEHFGTGDFARAMDRYDKRVTRGRGPSFGFEEVDEVFHGQLGLTFWLGPPKSYKSWIGGVNTIVENVINEKVCVLYSLELPAEETDMRIRCMAANVPYWKYLKGALMPDDKEKLREASEMIDSLGAYHVIKPPPGERQVEFMISRARDLGAECIVLDQLQYIETSTGRTLGAKNDTGDYYEVCNKLRDESDEGPITVIHQFNRSVRNADEMPDMQQAKGSSAIEETATTVLGLWANKDMRASGVLELGTLASRNYGLPSWTVGVELSRGCNFQLMGQVS
jgi:replicative DNA helicase